jgi:hypothetical protein
LKSLSLSPKSKVHIRGVIRELWDYAMYRGGVEIQRNPMELVRVKGATKRLRKPRCPTEQEFQSFLAQLNGVFRTMALVCLSFRLRISECLALRADAKQTDFCVYLSAILLLGLALNALLGWWWADPVAGLVMVPVIAHEGYRGFRAETCGCA